MNTPYNTAAAAAAASAQSRPQPADDFRYASGPTGYGMAVKVGECLPLPVHAKGYIYLGGPILGAAYSEARFGWRQYVQEHVAFGIRVLSPMRHEGHLVTHNGPIEDDVVDNATHFFAGSKVIFHKDVLDIRRCDVMLVNLLGATRPSLGSVTEIGMGYALDKTIVTVMEPGNIHWHPFVTEPSALVLDNLDDAIFAVNGLLSTGV